MAKKTIDTEIKVGLFVSIGVGLIMLSILLLGGAESFIVRQNSYRAYFEKVHGLIPGAKIMLNGIRVGAVVDVTFDDQRQNIRVDMAVEHRFSPFIKVSTMAEIATQGVLGDKFISLDGGEPDETSIEVGSEIPTATSGGIAQFLDSGEELMVNLKSISRSLDVLLKSFEKDNRNDVFFEGLAKTSKNLSQVTGKIDNEFKDIEIKQAVGHLNSILSKIDRGEGTLGAIINDPNLYYDARALLGGVSRNRVMRNLIRQTIKEKEQGEDSTDAESRTPARR